MCFPLGWVIGVEFSPYGNGLAVLDYVLNSLRAKFLSRNINMYLQFLSFLRTDMKQVVGILTHVRQGPAYFT